MRSEACCCACVPQVFVRTEAFRQIGEMSTGDCLGLIDGKAGKERSSSRRSDAIEHDFIASAFGVAFRGEVGAEEKSDGLSNAVGIGENGCACQTN